MDKHELRNILMTLADYHHLTLEEKIRDFGTNHIVTIDIIDNLIPNNMIFEVRILHSQSGYVLHTWTCDKHAIVDMVHVDRMDIEVLNVYTLDRMSGRITLDEDASPVGVRR